MNTFILLALLLSPTTATVSTAHAEPTIAHSADATTTAATVATPQDIVALPLCAPPPAGNWWIFNDCLMVGNRVAPRNVFVIGGRTLQLAFNASLDIDFAQRRLQIGPGGRVLVGVGGRIY